MKIMLSGEYLYKAAPWLTWDAISYGLNNEFIGFEGVVEYAFLKLNSMSTSDEIELATLYKTEFYEIPSILDRLVRDGERNILRDTWIYLLLLWIYEHRDKFDDPFGVAEELYAYFDYPEDISSIVRYMPLPEGEVGGVAYLYGNWRAIISSYEQRLKDFYKSYIL